MAHSFSLTTEARDRAAEAVLLRETVPLEAHRQLELPGDRDPVRSVMDDERDRLPQYLPLRRDRMATSPFAFFRGTAGLMAADLASTPSTGLEVQACGDAHLSNFGVFASPERTRIFDINDFDETYPAPWEWDVKRLAASCVVCARDSSLPVKTQHRSARLAVRAYQNTLLRLSHAPPLEAWYVTIPLTELEQVAPSKEARKEFSHLDASARHRTALRSVEHVTEVTDGRRSFLRDHDVLVPLKDMEAPDKARLEDSVEESYQQYLASLPLEVAPLLRRYRRTDVALKISGVGSVGTRCFLVLLEDVDQASPLLLQVKEARSSVLEHHALAGLFEHQGRRVVEGQRLIQGAADLLLGWSRGREGRDFYWRQRWDMKASVDLTHVDETVLETYAESCGAALAKAHARSGDALMISAYLGEGKDFEHAAADFSVAYADLVDQDYAAFTEALTAGALSQNPA